MQIFVKKKKKKVPVLIPSGSLTWEGEFLLSWVFFVVVFNGLLFLQRGPEVD